MLITTLNNLVLDLAQANVYGTQNLYILATNNTSMDVTYTSSIFNILDVDKKDM